MALVYLEDFLELVEELPNDFKHNFAQLRSLDLRVQNTLDSVDRKKQKFFEGAGSMSQAELVKGMNDIVQEYEKAKTAAEDKRQMTISSCEIMDRVIKFLDGRMDEFTEELKGINPGVIARLEERSAELDEEAEKQAAPIVQQAIPAPAPAPMAAAAAAGSLGAVGPGELAQLTLRQGGGSDAVRSGLASILNSQQLAQVPEETLAAAYKAAIAAAQSRSSAGGAVSGVGPAAAAASSGTATPRGSGGTPRQSASVSRKKKSKAQAQQYSQVQAHLAQPQQTFSPSVAADSQGALTVPVSSEALANEPLYCTCQNISYGNMICCDNDNCPIEWFHYGCVGLTEEPTGKWYCPYCRG